MVPIVHSLLETDLYKFTMWQALLHSHPDAQTEYEFVCRNSPYNPLASLEAEIGRELDHLCTLSFTEDELAYLRGLRYIKRDYVDFLAVFRFQRKFISVKNHGDDLHIRACGPQVHVMGFEFFVLYIVSVLYFRRLDLSASINEARRLLAVMIDLF